MYVSVILCHQKGIKDTQKLTECAVAVQCTPVSDCQCQWWLVFKSNNWWIRW